MVRLDQIAAYCDEAATHGVTELALTEHANRFVDVPSAVGSFWRRSATSPRVRSWPSTSTSTRGIPRRVRQPRPRAKDEGLPVKIGLEVDYYRGQMDEVSALLAQYPFDVLIGSVHWLDTWQFDDIDNKVQMHEWTVRDVDQCWANYAGARGTGRVELGRRAGPPGPHQGRRFFASNPTSSGSAWLSAAAAADVSIEVLVGAG